VTLEFPDPRGLLPDPGDPASARRPLAPFGLPFTALLIEGRGRRAGVPGTARPSFDEGRGPAIRAREALFEGAASVLTPNRFPFASPHGILWARDGEPREWPEAFLVEAFRLLDRHGGILLGNTVGASASIPLAHLHWADFEAPLLPRLAELPFAAAAIDDPDAGRRASSARRLLDRRLTAPANLLALPGRAWILPRREEIPSPHFPHALGAMELAGFFVYPDRPSFDAATASSLEAALTAALLPR